MFPAFILFSAISLARIFSAKMRSRYRVPANANACALDCSDVVLTAQLRHAMKHRLNLKKPSDNDIASRLRTQLEYANKDEYTHLYTLVLKADGSYKVLFDSNEKASGKLPEGWDFPPKEIDDPSDKKPADWVDEKQIPDPEDSKPSDWDQPERIPDPEATKPADWDDEMDGEWDPATIANPDYKGEWKQKMIDNPDYKGEWKPRQIPNPDYTGDVWVYEDNAFVGFELWSVHNNSIFDNILVTDDEKYAAAQAETLFKPTKEGEKAAKEAWDKKKKEKDTKKEDAAQKKDSGTEEKEEEETVVVEDDSKATKDEL